MTKYLKQNNIDLQEFQQENHVKLEILRKISNMSFIGGISNDLGKLLTNMDILYMCKLKQKIILLFQKFFMLKKKKVGKSLV